MRLLRTRSLFPALLSGVLFAHSQNQLVGVRIDTRGWARIEGRMDTNRLVTLETSPDLAQWRELALLDFRVPKPDFSGDWWATNDTFAYWDPRAPEARQRFYRFLTSSFAPTNDWKNQVLFSNDAFSQTGLNTLEDSIRWVKFAIALEEPWRVYYQDGGKYLLHHQFAAARLAPFLGMNQEAFDRVSLHVTNQQVLLGTVLFPPRDEIREFGIQFTGRDPYPREFVRAFFEQVVSTVVAPADVVPSYFPAFEQGETALIDEPYFNANGIRLSSVNRWITRDQVYAVGWALGRIRVVPANQIDAAYADGRLSPKDILVTDGVPAEVPFVAGIISTTPATPNSHVAILAQAYGIPFAFVASPAAQARALELNGREVVLQATLRSGFPQVSVLDVQDTLDDALRAELLALKQPPSPNIQPIEPYGAFSAPVDTLQPLDIRFFGGKAAHFGLLRRTIPDHCPEAIAFSFDLWVAFLGQQLPGGRTLAEEISARLAPYTNYPPDLTRLRPDLAAVRDLIARTADFTEDQMQAITNALARFEPNRKIRFRSSSNAEDSETFSAAGLYDSYSGCLADDLDADDDGPCRCDPLEARERGVFRAIRKVYASFYNDNAFLERLRHGLDEHTVGMAVLAHYSTPDDLELANGVATVALETNNYGVRQLKAKLVTQKGAVSVANPEGNALPETVEYNQDEDPQCIQPSSLVPFGSRVLDWPAEYETLQGLLFQVYTNYRPASTSLVLDFEYKKATPGKLLIKQVRPVPRPPSPPTQRYILAEAPTYTVYPKEMSDIVADHRLKCLFALRTASAPLTTDLLTKALYTEGELVFHHGTSFQKLSGPLSSWPNATHKVSQDPRRGTIVEDGWTFGADTGQLTFQLVSIVPVAAANGTPFLAQAEIRKWLRVTYTTPQPIYNFYLGTPDTATQDEIQLVLEPDPTALAPGAPETFSSPNGIQFSISFLNPTNTVGPPLGVDPNFWGTYPASYSPWMQTAITELTSRPLTLRGFYSQSAMPTHKHLYSHYLFDPELDPDLPEDLRLELRSMNIRWLLLERDLFPPRAVKLVYFGFDSKFRKP